MTLYNIPIDIWTIINSYSCETNFQMLPPNFTAHIDSCPRQLCIARADVISDLLRRANGNVRAVIASEQSTWLKRRALQAWYRFSALPAHFASSISYLAVESSYCTSKKMKKIFSCFRAVDTMIVINSSRFTRKEKRRLHDSSSSSDEDTDGHTVLSSLQRISAAFQEFAKQRIKRLHLINLPVWSPEFIHTVAQISSLEHLSYSPSSHNDEAATISQHLPNLKQITPYRRPIGAPLTQRMAALSL